MKSITIMCVRLVTLLVLTSTLVTSQSESSLYTSHVLSLSFCSIYWQNVYLDGKENGAIQGLLSGEEFSARRICGDETNNDVDLEKCVRCGVISEETGCNSTPNCQFVSNYCAFF